MIRSFNGKSPTIHPTAFISEACYIVGDVDIGENSSVWPGAVIRGDFGRITVGRNSVVQDTCVLHADDFLDIGDNVLVTHGRNYPWAQGGEQRASRNERGHSGRCRDRRPLLDRGRRGGTRQRQDTGRVPGNRRARPGEAPEPPEPQEAGGPHG